MFNFNNLLACPVCKNELTEAAEVVVCKQCNINYKNINGIHSFLCKELYASEELYNQSAKVIEFWGKGWQKRLTEPDHSFMYKLDQKGIESFVANDVDAHKKHSALFTNELDLKTLNGKIALNIGCGAGTEALLLSYYGANCVAMDITFPAAEAASKLIKNAHKSGMGIQADARFLPFKSNSLDLVYSSGVLHHSADINRSIEEIYRVLKPGGHAYIMLYSKYSLQFLQQRFIGFLKGYITKKQQDEYMSKASEGAWKTESRENPHTDTFSKAECRDLFKNYKNVSIRKGTFHLNQLMKINKILSPEKSNFLTKCLSFLDPYLGACTYIDAKK